MSGAVQRVATFVTRWTGLSRSGALAVHPQNIYGISNGHSTANLTVADLQELIAAATPRTVATVEEIDALPGGSVIRDDDGDVFEAVRCAGDMTAGVHDYNCWDQIGETWPLGSDKIKLPAIVLSDTRR